MKLIFLKYFMGYLILIMNKINYFYSSLKQYIESHPHSRISQVKFHHSVELNNLLKIAAHRTYLYNSYININIY